MSTYNLLNSLVKDNELENELKVRSKHYYEVSTSFKKFPIYEAQGWYVLRENKTSYRIRLDKTVSEILEDDIWSLYARLGFKELNEKREFQIQCGESSVRKIDLFAKDDETVLITECTSAESPGTKKSITYLIDKIKSYREDIIKATHNYYGKDFKPRFGWIIATKNIIWSDPDIIRAAEADIYIIRDEELDYFIQLQKHLKIGARFQFLASVFSGKSIKELNIRVPATKGKMGGVVFYTFLISPEQLLKIAYVGHKNSKGPDALDTYQRMLKPKRLKDIAQYINNGGKFPTNIVVNMHYKKQLNFIKKDEIGELSFGELNLPNCYASAWVIDGQHRLFGYALSDRAATSVVPVLAFVNLDSTSQKNMFVDINHKQVKVPQGLLLDLYSELHWGSEIPSEAITSLCSKVTKVLGASINSPLNDRIVIGENKKTNYTCLTIATITSSLLKEQLIGTPSSKDDSLIIGPLGDSDLQIALKKATDFLSMFFTVIKDTLPDQWELGDAQGGYICTNNAIAAFFKVLRAIFDVLEKVDHIDLLSQSAEDLMKEVSRYLSSLTEWLKGLDQERFVSLRSKVGSKGQIAVAWEMQQAIYERNQQFKPKGLVEWMESFDKEGTTRAKKLIDGIQIAMYEFTIWKLKEKYKDNWWYDGIPETVRTKCAERKEKEKGKFEIHQYLDLIDYKTIALASGNWSEIFQHYFAIGKQGDRHKKLSWVVHLNDIRKTVSHPERGLLSKEQVDFVATTYNELKDQITEFWRQ